MKTITLNVLAVIALAAASAAHAQVRITEVAPYASGNTPFAADWFELTNFGNAPVLLDNWRIDDNSNAFASAVPMLGIASIAPGESVIFLECAAGCAAIAGFRSFWGGPAATVQIGTYNGAGVGLGTGGDAVNVFDSAGAVLARVDVGASTAGRTFDNAAGLNNVLLSTLSTVGVNGAFTSTGTLTGGASGFDIGSPGLVAAIPEPASVALLLGGLAALAAVARRRG
jgi:hypothetical protein